MESLRFNDRKRTKCIRIFVSNAIDHVNHEILVLMYTRHLATQNYGERSATDTRTKVHDSLVTLSSPRVILCCFVAGLTDFLQGVGKNLFSHSVILLMMFF